MGLLSSMALDSTVKIAENGVPQEYIVFHHGVLDPLKVQGAAAEVDSCYQETASGTWLLRKRSVTTGRSHSSSQPHQYSYKDSLIDPWLTSNYLPTLSAEIRENLINITIPYTIYDEEASSSSLRNDYSVMVRNVFIPSENELRIHWDNNTIKTMSFENFWFRNAGFSGAFHDFFSTEIGYSGSQTASDNYGYRPFIVVRSSLFVQTDGLVVSNTPPVISGNNGDLGSFGENIPSYQYTVTDTQGGIVNVTEKLDSTTLRTYQVTLGSSNTLTFSADEWRKVLNGKHTLTITATDEYNTTDTRTQTFTKKVTSCSFVTTDAFPSEKRPDRCILVIQGAFPVGSNLKIEACNNGNDVVPTWEDITQNALNNQKYFFDNMSKTADSWGVKFRVSLSRGSATGDCYISLLRGNFQAGNITTTITDQEYSLGLNLLDNAYFVGGGSQQGGGQFPINQRGQTSYNTPWQYGIDRWTISGTSSVSLLSNGLSVAGTGVVNDDYIFTRLENLNVHQTYTLSALFEDNTGTVKVSTAFGESSQSTNAKGLVSISFPFDADQVNQNNNFVRFHSSKTATLIAAKLELGSRSTLARKDESGNWVLNDPPPNFQQELAKCQRYLFDPFMGFNGYSDFSTGIVTGQNSCSFLVSAPVNMRIFPSLIQNNLSSFKIYTTVNGIFKNSISITSISILNWAANRFNLNIYAPENLSVGEPCGIYVQQDAGSPPPILFSAEL